MPFTGTIHYSKAPDFTDIKYHRNYKCAQGQNVAKNIKKSECKS